MGCKSGWGLIIYTRSVRGKCKVMCANVFAGLFSHRLTTLQLSECSIRLAHADSLCSAELKI